MAQQTNVGGGSGDLSTTAQQAQPNQQHQQQWMHQHQQQQWMAMQYLAAAMAMMQQQMMVYPQHYMPAYAAAVAYQQQQPPKQQQQQSQKMGPTDRSRPSGLATSTIGWTKPTFTAASPTPASYKLWTSSAVENKPRLAAVPSLKNQVFDVADKAAQNRKCASTRNVAEKANDEEKEKPVNRSKQVQRPRKEVKAFTSTLTARSKAIASLDASRQTFFLLSLHFQMLHICWISFGEISRQGSSSIRFWILEKTGE